MLKFVLRDLLPFAGLAILLTALVIGMMYAPEELDLDRAGPAPTTELPRPGPGSLEPLTGQGLSGVLVDAEGELVSDGLLAVENDERLLFTFTDEEGAFSLSPVPQEAFEVLVLARGFEPDRLDVAGPSTSARLMLAHRRANAPSFTELEASDLSGLVALPASPGPGILPLELWLKPVELASALSTALRVPRRVTVGPDGAFSLPELAHGTYELTLLPAWASGGSYPDLLAEPADRLLVHPGPGPPPVLRPTSAELRVQVVQGGKPVDGAVVELLRLLPGGERPWPRTYADSEGAVLLSGLPPGTYSLRARAGRARGERRLELSGEARLELPPLELVLPDGAGQEPR